MKMIFDVTFARPIRRFAFSVVMSALAIAPQPAWFLGGDGTARWA